MDPTSGVDSKSMADMRKCFLQAIGAYEHGMVGLQPERPTPAPAPEAPPPPAAEGRPITADDFADMPLKEILKTLRGRHLWSALGIVVTLVLFGGGLGSVWGGLVEKKSQELAVERLTSERDTCRQEVASLKASPTLRPSKTLRPELWRKGAEP